MMTTTTMSIIIIHNQMQYNNYSGRVDWMNQNQCIGNEDTNASVHDLIDDMNSPHQLAHKLGNDNNINEMFLNDAMATTSTLIIVSNRLNIKLCMVVHSISRGFVDSRLIKNSESYIVVF